MRRLLCTIISLRTGESVQSIVEKFEERVKFSVRRSDIPNAYAGCIIESKENRPITNLRRYDIRSLKDWLESGLRFDVIQSNEIKESLNSHEWTGIMIARKREQ
jgi:hypothetical protein